MAHITREQYIKERHDNAVQSAVSAIARNGGYARNIAQSGSMPAPAKPGYYDANGNYHGGLRFGDPFESEPML